MAENRTEYKIYDKDSAPDDARPLLKKSEEDFGMIPNLHGVMAEAPTLLEGYQKLHDLAQKTSFNKDELTVVWQTINVENECHYCVPAHTGIAKNMGVSDALIDALRNDEALENDKLRVLKHAVLSIIRNRGRIDDDSLSEFFNVGYERQQLLEIVLIYAQKIMSNYTNHMANTPVDEAFEAFKWNPEKK